MQNEKRGKSLHFAGGGTPWAGSPVTLVAANNISIRKLCKAQRLTFLRRSRLSLFYPIHIFVVSNRGIAFSPHRTPLRFLAARVTSSGINSAPCKNRPIAQRFALLKAFGEISTIPLCIYTIPSSCFKREIARAFQKKICIFRIYLIIGEEQLKNNLGAF